MSELRTVTVFDSKTFADNSPRASLLFAGDVYLAPGPPRLGVRWLDARIRSRIEAASYATANYESAVENRGDRAVKDGPHLASSKSALPLLKATGFDCVVLANNHVLDFGLEGLRQTVEDIRESGLDFAGVQLSPDAPAQHAAVTLPGGDRVTILSFCEREFGTNADGRAGAAWLSLQAAAPLIAEAKRRGELVVVQAHGGNEYVNIPSAQRRDQLRNLVDLGADLVIGHHPHVAQGWERYKDAFIFYSIGDFYFDYAPRNPVRDWSYFVEAYVAGGRIGRIDITPFERVADEVVPLGAGRDPEACLEYLHRLSAITASGEFQAYWQEMAVKMVLERYLPYFRHLLPQRLAPRQKRFLPWLKDATRAALNAFDYYGLEWFASFHRPSLALLNLMRCESHRWALETGLAVLSGETPDLRTPATKKDLADVSALLEREAVPAG